MRCLKSMIGVSRIDRVRNEDVKQKTGVEMKLSDRLYQKGLSWFGDMGEQEYLLRVPMYVIKVD
ncbi:hypothetical protein SK128_016799 [Halocaridina rubra]|uniref:Uncharacterized protein n=1 Tax=Halocaridina rubra TaxID=373956 RepID=A0AAN9A9I1_HALRR